MEEYKKLELDATYRVTLHRNLIEADFSKSLTLVEQRLLYAAISNIPAPKYKIENGEKVITNPITELPKFKMSVKEFSDLLGWKEVDYKKLSKVSGELMSKVITAKPVDNSDDLEQFQWVAYTRYIKGTGTVLIELHPRLLPFIANLTENFASVTLDEIMKFKSKYTSRLFFLLKQWEKLGHKTVTIDEIRKIIGVGYTEKDGKRVYKLSMYHQLRQRAIESSIAEINEFTDLNISYSEINEGKKVVAIDFHIEKKKAKAEKAPKKEVKKEPEKEPEQPQNIYEEIAFSISHLNFNVEAYQNIAKELSSIKNIRSIKKHVISELNRLASYVLENGTLGAGFVINQVKKSVSVFHETNDFNFNDLIEGSKPKAKPGVKVEKVPEWFYKRQKNNQDQQPQPEAKPETDFEAERAKILAKLKAQ